MTSQSLGDNRYRTLVEDDVGRNIGSFDGSQRVFQGVDSGFGTVKCVDTIVDVVLNDGGCRWVDGRLDGRNGVLDIGYEGFTIVLPVAVQT